MSGLSIADLRRDYAAHRLAKADLDPDPIAQFRRWLDEALAAELPEPTAMSLGTCGDDGQPSSRIVLLKALDERGFGFYTNYESRKGRELARNPWASLNFFWPQLERQVCVSGSVAKMSREESAQYFHSRPRASQLGAIASAQSATVPNRTQLEEAFKKASANLEGRPVPLPEYWGGFIVRPVTLEFWQGRPSRLHDRLRYSRESEGWRIDRLSP